MWRRIAAAFGALVLAWTLHASPLLARQDAAADATVVVEIRDEKGRVVPGATLRLAGRGRPRTVLDADAEGRCRVPIVRGASVRVRAAAPGDLVSEICTIEGGRDATVALEVRQGTTIEGVVVHAGTGVPVAGAVVTIGRASLEESPDEPVASLADGGFGPVIVHSWDWSVSASADGYFENHEPLRAPRTGPLRIALLPHGSVSGTVRAPDGSPVAGAVVGVLHEDDRWQLTWLLGGAAHSRPRLYPHPWVTTDAAGAYRVGGLRPGVPYRVIAAAAAWAPGSSADPVELTAAAPDAVVPVTLVAGVAVHVDVRDPGGARIAGASVLQEVPLGSSERTLDVPWEAAAGVFRIGPVLPGPVAIVVKAPGFVTRTLTFDARPGDPRERVVELPELVPVRVRVVDDAGQPVGGARVLAHPVGRAEGLVFEPAEGRSGPDGTADFLAAPCELRLHAYCRDHVAGPSPVAASAPARRDATTGPVAIRLLRLVRLASARVTLIVPGECAPPADVVVLAADGTRCLVWNGGRYHLRSLVPGGARLFARGFAPIDLGSRVQPGTETDLGDVTLDPGVTLRGRVVDDTGAPVAGALVWVVQHDSAMDPRARTAADGAFAVPHVPPDENDVRVVVADATRWTGTLRGDAKAELQILPTPR